MAFDLILTALLAVATGGAAAVGAAAGRILHAGLLASLGKTVKAYGVAVRKQRLRYLWRNTDLKRQNHLEATASKRVEGQELKPAPSRIPLDDAITGLRNSTGDEAKQFARQIAEMSTHINQNGSRVVLGRWADNGGYIGEAKTNGGVWYETDSSFFSKLSDGLIESEARGKAWSVNEQFLQSQLELGVRRIDLHGETIQEVLINRPNSFTAMEIKYLETNAKNFGYVRDGNSWVKAD